MGHFCPYYWERRPSAFQYCMFSASTLKGFRLPLSSGCRVNPPYFHFWTHWCCAQLHDDREEHTLNLNKVLILHHPRTGHPKGGFENMSFFEILNWILCTVPSLLTNANENVAISILLLTVLSIVQIYWALLYLCWPRIHSSLLNTCSHHCDIPVKVVSTVGTS